MSSDSEQVSMDRFLEALKKQVVQPLTAEIHDLKHLVERSQATAGFYQDEAGKAIDKVHLLEEALFALKTRSKKVLQYDVYRRVQEHGGYVDLAAKVLEAFIEELKVWDATEHPLGIHYTKVADHFFICPTCKSGQLFTKSKQDPSHAICSKCGVKSNNITITVAYVNSIRRRLNELSMKHAPDRKCPGCRKCHFGTRPHIIKCGGCAACKYEFVKPPLKWTEPGFYLPRVESELQQVSAQ